MLVQQNTRGSGFFALGMMFQHQLNLGDGVVDVPQGRFPMAAETVLGFLELMMGVLELVDGMVQVRMMGVLFMFLAQVGFRRRPLARFRQRA